MRCITNSDNTPVDSTLTLDHDLSVIDAIGTNIVTFSASYTNSYEIVEFTIQSNTTYQIFIHQGCVDFFWKQHFSSIFTCFEFSRMRQVGWSDLFL